MHSMCDIKLQGPILSMRHASLTPCTMHSASSNNTAGGHHTMDNITPCNSEKMPSGVTQQSGATPLAERSKQGGDQGMTKRREEIHVASHQSQSSTPLSQAQLHPLALLKESLPQSMSQAAVCALLPSTHP